MTETSRPDVEITVGGLAVRVPEGANLGAMLHTLTDAHLRDTPSGRPRGLYCGMGVCFDCVVLVNGRPERACLTRIAAGMSVVLPRSAPA